MPQFLDRDGTRLAYEHSPGEAPGIVFLGGFKSDMTGTKAVALEDWARRQGRAFLRLDYSGHGQSGGTFEEGSIGRWRDDALAVIANTMPERNLLVGSSMGGWIALLIARDHPDRVGGLVTIAAAPDFTEDGYWAAFSDAQRVELFERGHIAVPSDYGEPYVITRHLIEEGRDQLVLRTPLPLPFPVRMLQGTADADVPQDWAIQLLGHAEGPDLLLTLVKGADHRFSEPAQIDLIERSAADVLSRMT
ncbi:alpha/beta fold hydrolase [Jannaschia aquimarina]|uniref:Palmitoyl-protein thioesterase ABHD10, mitochondrial n=1 Tax=Jannaschia aquimarina TaxID=935700 RepID=A0A0D1D3E2_9RHOB|nr:alpha/beta hydrolase [Jannaschia aquimarina]KIT14638.1 Dihydrolipoyllysine-residue acetyltransferase component of acetoin cleaving system [Jannaschia aquimarina]SNT37523.1 Pimeloyl-ACP methyl ester carboxylesterase [Jannaschia aquimarina]